MDSSIVGIILAFGVGLGVALAFWGVTSAFVSPGAIDRRLAELAVPSAPVQSSAPALADPSVVLRMVQFTGGLLTRWLRDVGAGERIARDLLQADLRMSVGEFVIAEVAAAAGGLVLALLVRGDAVSMIACATIGWAIPGIYVRRRRNARIDAMVRQLGHTISVIANALRAGSSLLQAFQMISREMPDPTATEFGRVVREVGLGLTFEQALWNMLKRVPGYELELVVIAITIQYGIGGNLAPVLDNISDTIRERVRIRGDVKALTAQQTYSGYLLAFLPVGLIGILYMMSPDYIGVLFQPGPAMILLFGAILSIAIGFMVIQRITRIAV
ncbi:MAG: type II secretion system F family protein [Chloroflexi bacterium]|nr:type II secretion system F family protein [Chloroflexota bacterium]